MDIPADACPSVAYAALGRLLHLDPAELEPDTLRIELQRRGVEPTPALMAKLLGAQTVVTTRVWTHDHDALFAFALACDGIAPTPEGVHHPSPEQLAWAMREVTALTSLTMTDEEGFDPDAIDPALAVVLHDAGWIKAPQEYAFCQDVLDGFARDGLELLHAVNAAWAPLARLPLDELHAALAGGAETALNVQLRRLADCRAYVAAREQLRARQAADAHG